MNVFQYLAALDTLDAACDAGLISNANLSQGESYAPTICFIGRRLVVECWAYWVESGRVREGSHYDQ